MKTLYEYIYPVVYESAIIDTISEIVGIIKDTVSSSTDAINTVINAKKEIESDKKLQHEAKVERILLYMLKNKKFYEAIKNHMDEIELRLILHDELKKSDIKYIPDIIRYINTIRNEIK